jgi:glycosyltransferase involved in cell wall biosynthesis
MKNCLVFLTKTFPFGTGEEFIANELPVVARKFEKVFLIATSVADSAVQTRAVPENTEVHAIRASSVKRAVLPGAVKALLACPAEFRSDSEKHAMGQAPIRRLYLSYFIAKGTAVAQKSAEILAKTEQGQADSVTFYSYWFYDTALAALMLKRICRVPRCKVYCRAHGYDLYPARNPSNYLPLRPYLLQNLDGIFPCSKDGSGYLKRTYPQFADKIVPSYLGTTDHGLGPAAGTKEFHVVSCCHIVPVKRVELLAEALAKLSGSGLHLKWTHFGGGDGLDALQKSAAENLRFMKVNFAGEIGNEQLMEFYRTNHVDLFVNTSRSEGLPVSIMEACSFGIPVLATNVGGTGEIVRTGLNGFLVDMEITPDELAREMKRILLLPEPEQNALRLASRKIWEENFNAERNYSRFARSIG